ncbi:hypothetical protein Tco_0122143 [Tanacetum coccineum]
MRQRENVQIKQRIQAARDCQKSYANVRHKPLEFQVGDRVMLKFHWMKYALMISSASLEDQWKLWIVKSSIKAVSPSSKFDGTPGELLSSHGNVKTNSGRNIHNSSQKPHPRQVPHLEPCG